ncbi:protein of unknown function (plasmid) [Caballeronia sp. S22]
MKLLGSMTVTPPASLPLTISDLADLGFDFIGAKIRISRRAVVLLSAMMVLTDFLEDRCCTMTRP